MGEFLYDQFGSTLSPSFKGEDREIRSTVLTHQCFDERRYEYDFRLKPNSLSNPWGVQSTSEMLQCLENDPSIEVDSRILGFTPYGLKSRHLNRNSFLESFKKNESLEFNFKEFDSFSRGDDVTQSNFIGQDFTPLLGGPFYKNLYYYGSGSQSYLAMHSECFYAYHNDPIAKAIISITRDFVIGTGFEVQCDTSDRQGQIAMAIWKSFEQVNDLQQQMNDCCLELGIYGENLLWWLPNNQTKIVYQLSPGDEIPTAIIPRVRLLDPSNMIEIVTYPEDITRKLFYVWLTPTQYQIYTHSDPNSKAPPQPTLKFIYQQIPADQILHLTVNKVSNEKRGRSDLFPVLSYLKRLRDSVNYSIIALQKVSAWAMDTEIKGNQADIDAYVQAQAQLPTIPFAGSEFVHSDSITRKYLGNTSAGGNVSDAYLYCLSLICAGVQIPFNYLGTHLSSGTTRASALVATEPVAKKMENRREVIKRTIQDLWRRLMKEAGLAIIDCSVVFPEIITQDRSQKLQDLALGEQQGWWSKKRSATIAAKEMGMTDYDFNSEQENVKAEMPSMPSPLSSPSLQSAKDQPGSNAMTSQDKKGVKDADSQ